MGYNARGGHGYGQQSHHNSGAPHYSQKKPKPTFKAPAPNNELDREKSNISTAFSPAFLVKIAASWTQPSLVGRLPPMESKKAAFQLVQVLANRKELELELIESNQNILRFKVSKQEDPDPNNPEITEQPPENIILPNQSYASFEYVSNLRSELAQFGYSLIAEG